MTLAASKDALRASLLAARAGLTPSQWAADNASRTALLLGLVDELEPTVASVYASRADEPGTVELIDALVNRGWEVLLPKVSAGIAWAWFDGWDAVAPGWHRIPNPTGAGLPAETLHEAGLIVVPCLAVGPDGARLGTGGGWYDRALPHRDPEATVLALARHEEVRDDLAALTLPHDVPVGGFVTERVSVLLPR